MNRAMPVNTNEHGRAFPAASKGRKVMRGKTWWYGVGLAGACGAAAWLSGAAVQAAPAAKTGHAAGPTGPAIFKLSSRPPKGAIVLYSGKASELIANWVDRASTNPPQWTVDETGAAIPSPNPHRINIVTKREFGDCYLHVEFAEPLGPDGKTIREGNSGIGFQSRYEVQILDSYGKPPDKESCASLYNQKPPIATASKKPGEWQTYDIIFRAPRLDANGEVVEKPRVTVFQNGVLVQDNEEFLGPTGIQKHDYPGMPKTGPLMLQGDHDPVHFRNIWVVPL